MSEKFSIALSAVGGALAAHLGGWSVHLTLLVVLMTIDYVSGFVLALLNRSKKGKRALSSNEAVRGLFKKGMAFGVILVARCVDYVSGFNYIADIVTIWFIASESLSIIENAGLIGVPVPEVLKRAIEVLKQKTNGGSNEQVQSSEQIEKP